MHTEYFETTDPSKFTEACEIVERQAAAFSGEEIVQLYGLFKQAKLGDCPSPPGIFCPPTERAKRRAWWAQRGRAVGDAQALYVSLVESKKLIKGDPGLVKVSALRDAYGSEVIFDDCFDKLFDAIDKNNMSELQTEIIRCRGGSEVRGIYPMHTAADRGNVEILCALLNSNVWDINSQDSAGDTPLHCAAASGKVAAWEVLVARGAQVDIRNRDGCTALDLLNDDREERSLAS